jgi:putative nucleotidyltransferase with HDIG domain
LQFNRFFLQAMRTSLSPAAEPVSGGTDSNPDPLLYDSSAFYLCPDGLRHLQGVATASAGELFAAARAMGVFEDNARRALQALTRPDITERRVSDAVEADPLLASLMIGFANSPLFGAERPIETLPHAITFVGVEPARQLVLGSILRRAIGHNREHWAHAVAVAQQAEAVAELAGQIEPALAFLAGLVHDIGRMIFDRLPAHKLEVVRRVHERGCPLGHAEFLMLGTSHGQAGACYLQSCRFESGIVEGVCLHHRPDLAPSGLASVLFLAEHLSGSGEDSFSSSLIETACARLGISFGALQDLRPKPWAELLLAA